MPKTHPAKENYLFERRLELMFPVPPAAQNKVRENNCFSVFRNRAEGSMTFK
jgi:hypothetical protein